MTLADILREEGREIGLEKGRKEAREMLLETTLQLIQEKFGKMPSDMKESIQALQSDELQQLILKLIHFETIEEVRKYL